MLKQQAKLFNRICIFVDSALIVGSFLLAYYTSIGWSGLNDLLSYCWVLLIIIPVWHFLLSRFRLYASIRTSSLGEIFASLIKVQFIGGIIISAVIFLAGQHDYSRGLIGEFLVISLFIFSLEKTILVAGLSFIRSKGYNFRNLLIVGTEEEARSFISLIEQHAKWGLRIIGILQARAETPQERICGYKVLGSLDALVEACKANPVDEVVFCLPVNHAVNVDESLRDLEELGITVRMVLGMYDIRCARRELSLFDGEVPILTFYHKAFDGGQLFVKRCLDIAGSAIGLSLTALFLPFIAIAIKLDSAGPLFFGQWRLGENGRVFICWKFRSMYIDAEKRKQELSHLNEMSGAIFKIKDDPRITRIGKFLRKTSLDELPQFWNVLKGEMSLVGTRPPTPNEVAEYENWHRRRISIKPGITGLWQVSGRNRIQDFDEIVRLDLRYIDNWSLCLDLRIMIKTLWVVFARHGSS